MCSEKNKINEINEKIIKALEEKIELLEERIDILNLIINKQNERIVLLQSMHEIKHSANEFAERLKNLQTLEDDYESLTMKGLKKRIENSTKGI